MKLRRTLALFVTTVSLIFPFAGCKENDVAFDETFFGPELYNASYVYIEGDTVEHIIPLMSKIDLSDLESVHEITDGATYTMTFKTESYEKTVGEYRLYKIFLIFSDIVFKKEKLEISEIQITTATGERLAVVPNKCEIVPPLRTAKSGLYQYKWCTIANPHGYAKYSAGAIKRYSSNRRFNSQGNLLD